MGVPTDEMLKSLKTLCDADKLRIVDALLEDLDKPDPDVDRVWADEAGCRYRKFREGGLHAVDYEQVMSRYRKQ